MGLRSARTEPLPPSRPPARDGPDELRRRLYRQDATLEDVTRYRAASGDEREGGEQEDEPLEAVRTRGPRRRALLAAVVVIALAAVGIGVTARSHPLPAPHPTPLSAVPPDDTELAVPADARAAFIASLDTGGSAEVLQYIFDNPDARPAPLRTVMRADSTEHWGSGPAEVSLSPSQEAEHGGRFTVALTVNRLSNVVMTVIRADSGNSASFIERLDAGDGVRARPGVPAVRTILYSGEAPTDLRLTVPRAVHWDLVVVFSD
jgi:hypothetical protein